MRDLRGKRVLVTGAAGFVGANLIRRLVEGGAQVHAVVRSADGLWRIEDVIPALRLHVLDLQDRAGTEQIIHQTRPEIVFHLAAMAGHPSTPEERERLLRSTVLATANLLDAVERLDFERFVHLGSSLEYGPRDRPLKESDLPQPVTFRGAVKAAATLLCLQFARAAARPVVVLRPFSVYGYFEAPGRLIPILIRTALCDGEIDLTAPGYRRDLVFVEDVVQACLLAIEAENVGGEIINIGSGKQWSNEEVVELVEAACGKRIRVRHGAYSARPSDTTHWVAEIRKAQELLAWQPAHTLPAGLEKTVSWIHRYRDVYLSRQAASA